MFSRSTRPVWELTIKTANNLGEAICKEPEQIKQAMDKLEGGEVTMMEPRPPHPQNPARGFHSGALSGSSW